MPKSSVQIDGPVVVWRPSNGDDPVTFNCKPFGAVGAFSLAALSRVIGDPVAREKSGGAFVAACVELAAEHVESWDGVVLAGTDTNAPCTAEARRRFFDQHGEARDQVVNALMPGFLKAKDGDRGEGSGGGSAPASPTPGSTAGAMKETTGMAGVATG